MSHVNKRSEAQVAEKRRVKRIRIREEIKEWGRQWKNKNIMRRRGRGEKEEIGENEWKRKSKKEEMRLRRRKRETEKK